jgi:hypothetical protein
MRLFYLIIDFVIGRGNTRLWNALVFILCIVPVFSFVEAIRKIEDPSWPGTFRVGSLLLILAFALMVDLVMVASTRKRRGWIKYCFALLGAAVLLAGTFGIVAVYDERTRSAGVWVVILTVGLFFLHLSLVRIAESLKSKAETERI